MFGDFDFADTLQLSTNGQYSGIVHLMSRRNDEAELVAAVVAAIYSSSSGGGGGSSSSSSYFSHSSNCSVNVLDSL